MSKLASRRRKNSMRRQLHICRLYDQFLSQQGDELCTRGENGLPGNDSIVFDLLKKTRNGYWLRNIKYV